MKGLNNEAKAIFAQNKEKGFWDNPRPVGELLMLVVSELGEALEAHRSGRMVSPEIVGTGMSIEEFRADVKDTFEDEIADAVIRLLDLCGGMGINIEWHIEAKLAYNKSRPRLHGKQY